MPEETVTEIEEQAPEKKQEHRAEEPRFPNTWNHCW